MPEHTRWGWGEKVGLALLVVATLFVMMPHAGPAGMPIPLGTPLPPLMAEGWLHTGGTVPNRESLASKVVVLDFWATTCPPCRAAMPKLAELHEKYQPMGVEFIGLTPEPESMLPAIEGFFAAFDSAHWPVGYGAAPTLDMLDIRGFPTLAVFNGQGKLVWSGHSIHDLPGVLDEALAFATTGD